MGVPRLSARIVGRRFATRAVLSRGRGARCRISSSSRTAPAIARGIGLRGSVTGLQRPAASVTTTSPETMPLRWCLNCEGAARTEMTPGIANIGELAAI